MPTGQNSSDEIVAFELAGRRYGIVASRIVELARIVTVVPLPRAPSIVEGLINFRGTPVPVLDVRARFHLPGKPAALSDHLIIASNGDRLVAFRVDRVLNVMRIADPDIKSAQELVPGVGCVAGVATLPDGLLLIHDLSTFLSQAESEALAALEQDGALS